MSSDRIGKIALVRYKGGITGDDPLDDRSTGDPLQIVLGVGDLPPGMDEAFLEMEIGEERTVVLPPEKAYGEHDEDGVQTYSRTFAEGFETLKVGDVITWTNPQSGSKIPVRVIKADEQLVTLDYNHPWAGEELTYWLQLVDIK